MSYTLATTKLTPRERDVVRLVSEGLKNKEIAEQLGTTEHVIKNYLRVIYDKRGVNRVGLALWWLQPEEEKDASQVDIVHTCSHCHQSIVDKHRVG